MSGCISDDELPFGSCKVPVSNIYRDTLFPFGLETIGQKCKVNMFKSFLLTGFFDSFKLILKDRFTVIQQPSNERTLSIIHTACGGEPQELHVKVVIQLTHNIITDYILRYPV